MVGLLKLPEENKNLFKAKVRLWLEMLIKKCGMKKAVKSGKPKETYETPEKQERWKIFWMRTMMGLYGCGNQSLLEVDESDDEPLDTKQDQLFEQEFDVEELLSCSGLRYWLKNAVKSGKPKEHMKLLKNTKDICVMPYILSSLVLMVLEVLVLISTLPSSFLSSIIIPDFIANELCEPKEVMCAVSKTGIYQLL
ncbi:unnamed protein product [Arabidopsis lyrata]|nr:unnamed protein product [Arabidopsis lyrata]